MSHKMPHTTGDSTKYKAEVHLPAVDAYMAGGWRDLDGFVCPTIEGYALTVKVSKPTLYNWCHKFKDFAEKMDELRLFCESSLVQGALGDRLKERTAALVLSTHYGYADKQQIDTNQANTPETVIQSIMKMLGKDAAK